MNDEIVSTGIRDRDVPLIDAEMVGSRPLTEHQKFVMELRELAAFYEARPDLELPSQVTINIWPTDASRQPVESAARIARLFGKASKETLADSYFMLRRDFGPLLRLEANWVRASVCERVVVGTEEVEEDVVISQTKERRTVTREKVEWRCPKSVMKEVGDGA